MFPFFPGHDQRLRYQIDFGRAENYGELAEPAKLA